MEYILLYFIVAEFVCDKRRLKNIVIVMIASATMIGVDCLFQYFMGFDFLRFRHLEAGRITGSFQMPGDLAGYLAPLLCLPLALSFLKLKRGIRCFLGLESILLLGLLVVSLVRGAWLSLMVAFCFLGVLENKKILYATVALLLILCLIMPQLIQTPDNILNRMKSIFVLSDTSSLDRKTIWQVAVRMIKDKPIFGHGLSTFMGNFARYGKDYYYLKHGIIPYAHNCYLQIAAETGIVGLVSFLTLIGTFFIHTIMSLAKIKDKFHHAVLSGISAGIIVTLVHSVVDTNLYSLQLSVLFWIMLGLNVALQRNFAFERTTN
jgi:putative inorganic carbon (HCO3(-)) transporter